MARGAEIPLLHRRHFKESEVTSMSLNSTPSSERVHIGFFGRRNAGKSSVVNRVTGQELSVVSDIKGTTTDPVTKAMELLPMGPVQIIDTPGIDDEGSLGELRGPQDKADLKPHRRSGSRHRQHRRHHKSGQTADRYLCRKRNSLSDRAEQSRSAVRKRLRCHSGGRSGSSLFRLQNSALRRSVHPGQRSF